ncbi:MAG: alpha/beta hydrolase [Acidimicrobiia bacterium]
MSAKDEPTADKPPLSRVFTFRLSVPGLVVGVFFFGLSLLPSLLPRSGLFQGVVSGITIAIGYGVGVLAAWAWNYLEIPQLEPGSTLQKIVVGAAALFVGFVVVATTWRHVGWQNDVREIFGMEKVDRSVWLPIIPTALVVASLLLIVARTMRKLFQIIVRWLAGAIPRRVARVLGTIAFIVLLAGFANGVLINGFFAAANSAFSVVDTSTNEGDVPPVVPERSGSPDSLVSWESLGRQGRAFVASGPTVDDLTAFHGDGAVEPIRIYAGLKSAETLQERADLVLDDLIRAGAFNRDVLVVVTATGTGYMVPEAMDTLEYIYKGNTAIAGVQYSYLPSWISLLADQQTTAESSLAVFDTIHSYWASLPVETRPEIYLFGLSLGSFGVESILTSVNIINVPIDGALMVGPPFVNGMWNEITESRDDGSPAWLPIFQEGRTVRFTALENTLDIPSAEWGDTKLVYLQHASDPVTFFSPDLALSEPDWLKEGQRGPDVSPDMTWVPVVTMWQVMFDLLAAGSVPPGHGHLFQHGEYIDGWVGVTEPDDWTSTDSGQLLRMVSEETGV